MNLFDKLTISNRLLQAMFFKRKTPLVITWNITYRCNLRCKYCRHWEIKTEEMATADAFELIKDVGSAGVKIIIISGGEPLLREDIKDIIYSCKMKGMYVLINSNGTLIKDRISRLRGVDEVKLSLDGPRGANDAVRGEGVFDKVIEAIEICKTKGIKVTLTAVISKYNVAEIPFLIEMAVKNKVGVYFQPADKCLSGDADKDISCAPDEGEFKNVIRYLLKEKSKGNIAINNSVSGLKHLYNWPHPRRINYCLADLIYCIIEPDGRIFVCDMFPGFQKNLVSIKDGFKSQFNRISLKQPCEKCWAGSVVEFNLLRRFDLLAMLGMWKQFR